MEAYLSCSYRDKKINAYFIEAFLNEKVSLLADQKSPTWCVAKIERHLLSLSGFVSVVPRRIKDDGELSFSEYIDYEIRFARRAGIPRLLFVDDEILSRYRSNFPDDAVPFVYDSPAADQFDHQKAIAEFKKSIAAGSQLHRRRRQNRKVTVVAPVSRKLKVAASEILDILSQHSYRPKFISVENQSDVFDEISIAEDLFTSELCVFMLDNRLSSADVLLGMSFAQFIPSIRLHYDSSISGCEDSVSGRIRWSATNDLVKTFKEQLASYRKGFVEVVKAAEETSSAQAAEEISRTQWEPAENELWDPSDGASPITHVHPSHSFVSDEIARVRAAVGGSLVARRSRTDALNVCRHIYNYFKTRRFAYEIEPRIKNQSRQAIRTPDRILNDKAATCLDLGCLFTGLLWAAQLSPLLLILDKKSTAHALVAYKAPNAILWEAQPDLRDIRAAIKTGDIIVFEPTGAVEAESPVGAETEEERFLGRKTLDFVTAQEAAVRSLDSGASLRYTLDVDAC